MIIETGQITSPTVTASEFTITTGLAFPTYAQVIIQTTISNIKTMFALPCRTSGSDIVVQVRKNIYALLTSLGDLNNLPSGVTSATTSGQTYDADTAHTHGIDHDHAAATSTATTDSGGGVATSVSGNMSTHTHSFDPPSFTGTSGAGSSHTHTWNNIYQHQHDLTETDTQLDTALANPANLTGLVVNYVAIGPS